MIKKVKVNCDSIKKLATDVSNHGEKINLLLDDLIKETALMEQFFDTPTCKIMKEKMVAYINGSKQYIYKKCDAKVNLLNNIAKLYSDTSDVISKKVGNN